LTQPHTPGLPRSHQRWLDESWAAEEGWLAQHFCVTVEPAPFRLLFVARPKIQGLLDSRDQVKCSGSEEAAQWADQSECVRERHLNTGGTVVGAVDFEATKCLQQSLPAQNNHTCVFHVCSWIHAVITALCSELGQVQTCEGVHVNVMSCASLQMPPIVMHGLQNLTRTMCKALCVNDFN
jgi:hypothetical protein